MQASMRVMQATGRAIRASTQLPCPSYPQLSSVTRRGLQLQLQSQARRAAPTATFASASTSAATAASAPNPSSSGQTTPSGRPSWEVRMLYDGDCPLCMKEVEFLRGRDAGKNKIDFVDIASPSYRPEDNAGLDYDTVMSRIHAISADGQVITGVEVFRRLYEAVGLGYVYAITRVEPFGSWAEALYNVWAKYRMEVTGREPLARILAKRKASLEGRDPTLSCGSADGAGECSIETKGERPQQ